MIKVEISVCRWEKSSEPPLWSIENVWLNPDHVVSIESTKHAFRGTDVDEFTEIHTTNTPKTRYITTEPADELARRLINTNK